MGKLTNNEFSKSFISRMQNLQPRPLHMEISKSEIQKCWQQEIPYLYKDKKRVRKSNRFIRANADGSEDIVELINPEHNLYANEVKFRKIKTSRPQGEGELFNLIKK